MLQKQATADKTVARDLDVKRKERDGDDIAGGGGDESCLAAVWSTYDLSATFIMTAHLLLGSLEFGWTSEATSHDCVEEPAASTSVFL
jgi:hypothetical protein